MNVDDGLTTIDFNRDWLCFCQSSTDRIDEKRMVSVLNVDQRWSSIHLPHVLSPNEQKSLQPCKWWYRKRLDWIPSTEQDPQQQVHLVFQPVDDRSRSSQINATVWLNGVPILRDRSLLQPDSIALSSKDRRRHNGEINQLVICCMDAALCCNIRLLIRGRVVCATGQVELNEAYPGGERKQNDRLNYTVTMDDADGRISVNFNPKRISKGRSLTSSTTDGQKREDLDDVLLIPRLAIVILIVGTRGDVQPFIA